MSVSTLDAAEPRTAPSAPPTRCPGVPPAEMDWTTTWGKTDTWREVAKERIRAGMSLLEKEHEASPAGRAGVGLRLPLREQMRLLWGPSARLVASAGEPFTTKMGPSVWFDPFHGWIEVDAHLLDKAAIEVAALAERLYATVRRGRVCASLGALLAGACPGVTNPAQSRPGFMMLDEAWLVMGSPGAGMSASWAATARHMRQANMVRMLAGPRRPPVYFDPLSPALLGAFSTRTGGSSDPMLANPTIVPSHKVAAVALAAGRKMAALLGLSQDYEGFEFLVALGGSGEVPRALCSEALTPAGMPRGVMPGPLNWTVGPSPQQEHLDRRIAEVKAPSQMSLAQTALDGVVRPYTSAFDETRADGSTDSYTDVDVRLEIWQEADAIDPKANGYRSVHPALTRARARLGRPGHPVIDPFKRRGMNKSAGKGRRRPGGA